MAKLSLVLAATVVAVAIAALAPSLTARTQSAARFEYLYVDPYSTMMPVAPGRVEARIAYRACVAATAEWTCRSFESSDRPVFDGRNYSSGPDAALRTVLVTLGSEGWDLVSAVDDTPDKDGGMTYVFKRQQQ